MFSFFLNRSKIITKMREILNVSIIQSYSISIVFNSSMFYSPLPNKKAMKTIPSIAKRVNAGGKDNGNVYGYGQSVHDNGHAHG